MSLKDRLNTPNNQNKEFEEKKNNQAPKYYESEKIAQIDTLGILDNLFVDDDINSIYVNGAKNIYIEKNGKKNKITTTFRDNVQLENLIRRNAQNIGIEIDESKPLIKFNHKEGINVLATLPPLSSSANIYIKCYKDKHATIQILSENQSISKEMSLVLEALATIKNNIIIAGEKNTLKTTVLSAFAKMLPNNNIGFLLDNANELKINSKNFSNLDISNLQQEKFELINSIINSNPDMVLFNDPDEKMIANICKNISEGLNCAVITICAKNPKEAMRKIALDILKQLPNLNFEEALKIAYEAFNLMIFCKRDESGKQKISSISQINLDENENCEIKDIFFLNHLLEHESTGFVPEFYETSKINNLPISANIFDKTYKHTYYKSAKNDAMEQFIKKSTNQDILRKFKKELPTNEIPEEEAIKKVQEKFEELKKNAKAEEQLEEIDLFEENLDDNIIAQNENQQ